MIHTRFINDHAAYPPTPLGGSSGVWGYLPPPKSSPSGVILPPVTAYSRRLGVPVGCWRAKKNAKRRFMTRWSQKLKSAALQFHPSHLHVDLDLENPLKFYSWKRRSIILMCVYVVPNRHSVDVGKCIVFYTVFAWFCKVMSCIGFTGFMRIK